MDTDALSAPSLFRYLSVSIRRLWVGSAVGILRSLAIAPCPLIFQRIIDSDVPARNFHGVAWHAAEFVGLLGLHWIFSIIGSDLVAKSLGTLMVEMRSRLFYRLQFLSIAFIDREKTGRLLNKYAFDTQRVETVLSFVLNQFIPNLLYSLSVFIVLGSLSWKLSILLLLAIPLWGVAKWRFLAKLHATNREARLAHESLTGTAAEYIGALRLVRSYGEEEHAEAALDKTSTHLARVRVAQSWVNALFGTFAYVSTQLIALSVMVVGAILTIRGEMTIGTLFAFVAGLPILLSPIQQVISMSEPWFAAEESFLSIRELITSPYVEKWTGTERSERLAGNVTFDGLTFVYPGTTSPVISNLNLSIQAGERVALVGPSGSGKSTLVNLLLGLHAPTEGHVLIDGKPQESWDMRWIRRQIAVVMQDSILLSGTIADNIRFARPEATLDEVKAAARMANAEEFILKLPGEYQSSVGERGVTLSGGQRQRLSIARAILRDPTLLVLDEATSALDYESERLVQEALTRLSKGRTVITIAHRLTTIRDATRIIVLSAGTIVEQGSYAELVAKNGAFARLIAAQQTSSEFLQSQAP